MKSHSHFALALFLVSAACGGQQSIPSQTSDVTAQPPASADGRMGTWNRAVESGIAHEGLSLAAGDAFQSDAPKGSLEYHIQAAVELVASYETGGAKYSALAGNFDGQCISFGLFQWNIGQGTLQGLLKEALLSSEADLRRIFGDNFNKLVALSKAPTGRAGLNVCDSLGVLNGDNVNPQWRKAFEATGQLEKVREIQRKHAKVYVERAQQEMKELGFMQVRSFLVLVQNAVQCGFTFKPVGDELVSGQYRNWLRDNANASEIKKLEKISVLLTQAVNPQFASDVESRIFTIIDGKGSVHGVSYDIEKDFTLSLSAHFEGTKVTTPATIAANFQIASDDGSANVRSEANSQADIIKVLKNGDIVRVGEVQGEWKKIEEFALSTDVQKFSAAAFVHSSLLKCNTNFCVIDSSDGEANIRTEASSQSKLVRVLKNGDWVTKHQSEGDWVKLQGLVPAAARKSLPSTGFIHGSLLSTGMSDQKPGTVRLNVPYRTQHDNEFQPGSTCGLTSAAMLLSLYGGKLLPDDLFLKYGKPMGQSPESLAELYRIELGNGFHTFQGTFAQVRQFIDKGQPVVMHGWFTHAGHVVLAVGYDAQGIIFHDPNGRWLGAPSEYDLTKGSGKFIHYTYAQMRKLNFVSSTGQMEPLFGGTGDGDGQLWLSTAKRP